MWPLADTLDLEPDIASDVRTAPPTGENGSELTVLTYDPGCLVA
ncbi:MAG: hypothetical protein AAF311_15815 [Pseudomonadota bacterium]